MTGIDPFLARLFQSQNQTINFPKPEVQLSELVDRGAYGQPVDAPNPLLSSVFEAYGQPVDAPNPPDPVAQLAQLAQLIDLDRQKSAAQKAQGAQQNDETGVYERSLGVRNQNTRNANRSAAILAGARYVPNLPDGMSYHDIVNARIAREGSYNRSAGAVDPLSPLRSYPTGPISGSPPPEDSPPEMSVDDRFAALPERWDVGNILPGSRTLVTEGDAPNRRRLIGPDAAKALADLGLKTPEDIGNIGFDELLRKVERSAMAPMGAKRAAILNARRKKNELRRAKNPKFDPANPTPKQRNIAARAARRGKPGLLESIRSAAQKKMFDGLESGSAVPQMKATAAIVARWEPALRSAGTQEEWNGYVNAMYAEVQNVKDAIKADADAKRNASLDKANAAEAKLKEYTVYGKRWLSVLDNPDSSIQERKEANRRLDAIEPPRDLPAGDPPGGADNEYAVQQIFPEGINASSYSTLDELYDSMRDRGYVDDDNKFTAIATTDLIDSVDLFRKMKLSTDQLGDYDTDFKQKRVEKKSRAERWREFMEIYGRMGDPTLGL